MRKSDYESAPISRTIWIIKSKPKRRTVMKKLSVPRPKCIEKDEWNMLMQNKVITDHIEWTSRSTLEMALMLHIINRIHIPPKWTWNVYATGLVIKYDAMEEPNPQVFTDANFLCDQLNGLGVFSSPIKLYPNDTYQSITLSGGSYAYFKVAKNQERGVWVNVVVADLRSCAVTAEERIENRQEKRLIKIALDDSCKQALGEYYGGDRE